ncbi:hypothetical protein [Burkholderia sp. Nafp2/4-1b]|uniref:hypothetical protein n=1 Tax=Burkholderia sp. Nafp2/4-1b TaxID=2116686 RepID=UPI0013CEE840|nr:hypothetical protein [Burkholderia sp. Nafp2/4-1b]
MRDSDAAPTDETEDEAMRASCRAGAHEVRVIRVAPAVCVMEPAEIRQRRTGQLDNRADGHAFRRADARSGQARATRINTATADSR